MSNIDILNTLSEGNHSHWLEHAEWREKNASWLDKSAKIALKVLFALKKKGMSKKDFASALGVSPQYVSKLLSGSENMGLETICKMEDILQVPLITVPHEYQTTIYISERTMSKTLFSHPLKITETASEGDYVSYVQSGVEQSA